MEKWIRLLVSYGVAALVYGVARGRLLAFRFWRVSAREFFRDLGRKGLYAITVA